MAIRRAPFAALGGFSSTKTTPRGHSMQGLSSRTRPGTLPFQAFLLPARARRAPFSASHRLQSSEVVIIRRASRGSPGRVSGAQPSPPPHPDIDMSQFTTPRASPTRPVRTVERAVVLKNLPSGTTRTNVTQAIASLGGVGDIAAVDDVRTAASDTSCTVLFFKATAVTKLLQYHNAGDFKICSETPEVEVLRFRKKKKTAARWQHGEQPRGSRLLSPRFCPSVRAGTPESICIHAFR